MVTKVDALDESSLRLGSRFVVHQPKLRPATWNVSELDHPKRFVWLAGSPGMQMTAGDTVIEKAPGESTVLLRFSFSDLLGGIVGRLFRSVTEGSLAQEAASLKRKAESSL
jgi:hypothetical protein